ncbi:pentatricopeptide repeat-containing protein At1g62930, chloroplastic-like [Lotus japonicus]|uniref:pentatricopeptide repeat-containing protein At1g62930, chloroplastic-like n=1 Tax=Lotus japonicus TaxID=34305 RepID=UPI0025850539|nr:pentatricopeptide repeat-containing protein At1g62930, chloroplastic-like [Lotus japonicus]
MEDNGCVSDAVTYETIIRVLFRKNENDKAQKLLHEMIARGLLKIFPCFLSILLEKIKDKGIQPDMYTYNIIIDGLCTSGRLKDALEVFQELLMKGYQLNVVTYNIMINGLCIEGLSDEALTLQSKMEDNGCVPDAVTYETIIRALFRKSENDKAQKFLHEMIARGLL